MGGLALAVLVALALPALGLRTAMPTVGVIPADTSARVGYERLAQAFGAGAPDELQVVAPARESRRVLAGLAHTQGVATAAPLERRGDLVLARVRPAAGVQAGDTEFVARVRSHLPDDALVGGPAAEAHDLERALARRLPLVYGLVVAVGFVLLLLVVRAPLAAAAAVLMNLLATAAAFGIAKLVFQDGHGQGLLGFSSQGFVDAWAPIFFFALIFALAMDYTVFLLSSVRAELERTGDPRTALVEGLAASGRVINAAGSGDGGRVLHLRPLGTACAQGDGRDPGRGGAARHAAGSPPAPARPSLRLLGSHAWWTPRLLARLPEGLRVRHG